MALDWILFSEYDDSTAERQEQDQTARMCSLILLAFVITKAKQQQQKIYKKKNNKNHQ